jgi:hypothetical protein
MEIIAKIPVLNLNYTILCNHSSPDVNGEKGKLYDDGVLENFNESAGKAIAYKYVLIKGNQEIIREQRAFRRRILADDGIAKWEDVWEK